MTSVGIVGVTGYTGQVLYTLLQQHPKFELTQLYSKQYAGQHLCEVCPNLAGSQDFVLASFDEKTRLDCDLLFLALPHGTSHALMASLLKQDCRVIDLSADFRFDDAGIFNHTYAVEHASEDLLSKIPYALPECCDIDYLNTQAFAIPGCYATAVNLALYPLIQALGQQASCIIDAKSGISGAGKGLKAALQYCEVSESFSAYQTGTHRHSPEMTAFLGQDLFFSPHLLPMARGILANVYVPFPKDYSLQQIQALYQEAYADAAFVRLLAVDQDVNTKYVKGTNFCDLAFSGSSEQEVLVLHAVIDNLMKGASGQAVQVANLAFGFDERLGLPVQAELFA
eukprot:COSAG01_NODE_128_length_24936_cov_324.347264_10_plen_340_part_00